MRTMQESELEAFTYVLRSNEEYSYLQKERKKEKCEPFVTSLTTKRGKKSSWCNLKARSIQCIPGRKYLGFYCRYWQTSQMEHTLHHVSHSIDLDSAQKIFINGRVFYAVQLPGNESGLWSMLSGCLSTQLSGP